MITEKNKIFSPLFSHYLKEKQIANKNTANADLSKKENLLFTYMKGLPFSHTALKDVSFQMQEGEFVGLIGHTGCGKSTLARLVTMISHRS